MLSGVFLPDADLGNIAHAAHHSPEEILAHPRFRFARDAYVKAILAIYRDSPILSRLLLESGRTVLSIGIMCLDARYDRGDRGTWPTLRLVTEQTQGVASPSRIHDLVRRLISAGFLEQRAPREDRRIRILTPTPKMIKHDQFVLASHYLPLQMLFPLPGYRPIMERDPAFQLRQRRVSADLLARGARIMASHPVMTPFLGRDAGAMVLLKLMQMVGPFGATTPLALYFSDFGARFGVSRTHLRNLLEEAEEQGLVRLTRGASRFVEPRPILIETFDRFVAESMAGHDLIYNLALTHRAGNIEGQLDGPDLECLGATHRGENHRARPIFT